MIRIMTTDGSFHDTHRYTYEQANAAYEAGVGIKVGGPDDGEPGGHVEPERTLFPAGIAQIVQL